MHMDVLQSLGGDDLLYMRTCHQSRTLSFRLMLRVNPGTTGPCLAFLAFPDLENIYFFFFFSYKSELLSLKKNLIRYFGACQGVAN